MRKIILSLSILVLTQNTFAQTFFGPESTSSNPAPASNAPVSADTFKNRVHQMNQQTESNLSQQVKPVTPTTPSVTGETPSFQNQPAGQPQENPAAMGAYPGQQAPAPNYGAPTSPPAGTAYAPNTPPPAQAPAANQPYTGFGTDSGKQNSGGSSTTNKSGGWGVKY